MDNEINTTHINENTQIASLADDYRRNLLADYTSYTTLSSKIISQITTIRKIQPKDMMEFREIITKIVVEQLPFWQKTVKKDDLDNIIKNYNIIMTNNTDIVGIYKSILFLNKNIPIAMKSTGLTKIDQAIINTPIVITDKEIKEFIAKYYDFDNYKVIVTQKKNNNLILDE